MLFASTSRRTTCASLRPPVRLPGLPHPDRPDRQRQLSHLPHQDQRGPACVPLARRKETKEDEKTRKERRGEAGHLYRSGNKLAAAMGITGRREGVVVGGNNKENGFTVIPPLNLSSDFCAGQNKHMRRGEARGEFVT